MKYPLRAAALCLFIFCAALPAFAAEAPDKSGWPAQLRFMAGPPGGNWSTLGTLLAEIWSREVIRTVSGSGGGVANIISTDSGEGDLGFSVTSFLGAAMRGGGDFRDKAIDNAVVMANLYTQVTYFIVRKDFAEQNGVRTLRDLLKKKVRFATLKPGTSSELAVRALLKMGYGTSLDELKDERAWTITYGSYKDGADLIAANRVDCLAFSVGSAAPVVMDLENRLDLIVLPIEHTALGAMAAARGTDTHTIRPGIYKSVSKATRTLSDYTCIVIRKDLPESLVYELNKSLWKNRKALAEAVGDMRELDPSTALPKDMPVHPGSAGFWAEMQ